MISNISRSGRRHFPEREFKFPDDIPIEWGIGQHNTSNPPVLNYLWYDASDANTLYDATVGGNLVGANGAVARWEDKGPTGRHVIQTVAADRPLRKTSEFNGLDAIQFDGINDCLYDDNNYSQVPPISGDLGYFDHRDSDIFIVAKFDGGVGLTDGGCVFQKMNGDEQSGSQSYRSIAITGEVGFRTTANTSTGYNLTGDSAVSTSAVQLITVQQLSSSHPYHPGVYGPGIENTVRLYLNGTRLGSGSTVNGNGSWGTFSGLSYAHIIGGRVSPHSWSSGSAYAFYGDNYENYFDGRICEIIAFCKSPAGGLSDHPFITDTLRENIEGYLMKKWNIT